MYIYIYIHCAFADPILLRKCLCRPHPSQELPLQTVSFAGIVFTDHILYIQELSFQSLAVRGIVLRNHNIFKKTFVHFFQSNITIIYVNIQPSLNSCHNRVVLVTYLITF